MHCKSIALSLVVAASGACTTPDVRVEVAELPTGLVAIAVEPLTIHYPADAWESVRRTQDVLDTLWAGSAWRILTPRDFSYRDPAASDPLQATDLVLRARDLGIDARDIALLRGTVSLNEARGQATVAGDDGVAVGRDYAATAVVRLTLVAMDGKTIVETEHQRAIDPFAERPDYDARPAVRTAILTAVASLLETCVTCVLPMTRPELPLFTNPVQMLRQPLEDGSTWREAIEAADALERDQRLWRAFQYGRPQLDLPEAQRLASTPPGACLGSEPPPPFRPGDCIIAVDNRGVDGVHALARALENRTQAHVLTVAETGGGSRIVGWPAP